MCTHVYNKFINFINHMNNKICYFNGIKFKEMMTDIETN